MTDYEGEVAALEALTMRELRQIARDEGVCLGYDGARKSRR